MRIHIQLQLWKLVESPRRDATEFSYSCLAHSCAQTLFATIFRYGRPFSRKLGSIVDAHRFVVTIWIAIRCPPTSLMRTLVTLGSFLLLTFGLGVFPAFACCAFSCVTNSAPIHSVPEHAWASSRVPFRLSYWECFLRSAWGQVVCRLFRRCHGPSLGLCACEMYVFNHRTQFTSTNGFLPPPVTALQYLFHSSL